MSSVRAVAAKFGFCFGSSAPQSSDATPIRDEPPTKRRKTILQEAPTSVQRAAQEHTVATEKKAKTVKSRKRLLLDDGEECLKKANTVDVEDSFVVGLETKKKAAKKTKVTRCEELKTGIFEDGVVKPAAKGRPRRQAAETAASKVTDGFAEEEAPIDKRRRDAVPTVAPAQKGRKRRAKEIEVREEVRNDQPADPISVQVEEATETRSKRPAPARKRKARVENSRVQDAGSDEENKTQLLELAVETPARFNNAEPASRPPKRSRKAIQGGNQLQMDLALDEKKKTPHAELTEKTDGHVDIVKPLSRPTKRSRKKKQQDNALNVEPQPVLFGTENEIDGKTAHTLVEDVQPPGKDAAQSIATRQKATERPAAVKSSRGPINTKTKRQPLRETNMNQTMRSESPEKPHRKDRSPERRTLNSATGEQHQSQRISIPENNTKPTTKRRKLQIQRDAIDTSASSGEQMNPNPKPADPLPEINHMTRHIDVVSTASRKISGKSSTGAVKPVPGTAIATKKRLSAEIEDPAASDASDAKKRIASKVKVGGSSKVRNKDVSALAVDRRRARCGNLDGEMRVDATKECGELRVPKSRDIVSDLREGEEEDVDWLFAPQQQAARPSKPSRQTTFASKVQKSRRKDVDDIDLDDLLSDIASFAREKVNTTSAQTEQTMVASKKRRR